MSIPYKSFLILLVVSFVSCQNPLEQKYNPSTFSEDLEQVSDSNRVILKNIFNTYEKAENSVDRIAGNEVILLKSLTFKQVLNNYREFHSAWRKQLQNEIVNSLDSVVVRRLNGKFLRENLKVYLLPEKVRDPNNGYVSRKILYQNQSNISIRINKALDVVMFPSVEFITLEYKDIIPAKDTVIKYLADYKINKGDLPDSKTELNYVLYSADYITFLNNGDEYNMNDRELLEIHIDDETKEDIAKVKKELRNRIQAEFPTTFWPYNSDLVKQKKKSLIDSSIEKIDALPKPILNKK